MNRKVLFGRIWTGLKIALGMAIVAQEHKLIRVKELPIIVDAVGKVDEIITEAGAGSPEAPSAPEVP